MVQVILLIRAINLLVTQERTCSIEFWIPVAPMKLSTHCVVPFESSLLICCQGFDLVKGQLKEHEARPGPPRPEMKPFLMLRLDGSFFGIWIHI